MGKWTFSLNEITKATVITDAETGKQTLEIEYPDDKPQSFFQPLSESVRQSFAASIRSKTGGIRAAKEVRPSAPTVERFERSSSPEPVKAVTGTRVGPPVTRSVNATAAGSRAGTLRNKGPKRISHDVWLSRPAFANLVSEAPKPTKQVFARPSRKDQQKQKTRASIWTKNPVPNVTTVAVKKPFGVGIVQPVVPPHAFAPSEEVSGTVPPVLEPAHVEGAIEPHQTPVTIDESGHLHP